MKRGRYETHLAPPIRTPASHFGVVYRNGADRDGDRHDQYHLEHPAPGSTLYVRTEAVNIEDQVEAVLRQIDQKVMYVRHHPDFDQVWYACTECVEKEHEEIVPKGEQPKLECPWNA